MPTFPEETRHGLSIPSIDAQRSRAPIHHVLHEATRTHRQDPIPRGVRPADLLARWPSDQPVVALISAPTRHRATLDLSASHERARWSILACPTRTLVTPALADPDRLHADLAQLEPSFRGVGPGAGWLGPDNAPHATDDPPPFVSGWIGWISYNAGALLEPALEPQRRSDWPLMVWQRCEGALIHDALADRWHAVGAPTPLPPAVRRAARPSPATLAPILNTDTPDAYQSRVARAIEYIRAGDVYQVNLAHTIDASLRASPRALSASLIRHAAPWYGAHVEHLDPDGRARAVCSASPELFLQVEPVRAGPAPRRILTRPMKGTLPGHLDPAGLERSTKDRAELDMIVDLMRNDLGRVARPASVRVEQRRDIEPHGGHAPARPGAPHTPAVWQGVATIAAHLRPDVSLLDLLRAVFPPGSVTGAPKIRAMQIIESLEDRPRGPYCGCIGFLGDDGRVSLSVAIRTALTEIPPPDPARGADASPPGLASYSVGAGIVADSDPAREWDETMHKAAALFRLGLTSDSPSIVGVVTADPAPPRPARET